MIIVSHGVADDGTVSFGVFDTPGGSAEGIKLSPKQASAASLLSLEHVTVIGTDPYGRAVIGGTAAEYATGERLIDTAPHYTRRLKVLKALFLLLFVGCLVLGALACALGYYNGNEAAWYVFNIQTRFENISEPEVLLPDGQKRGHSYSSMPDCGTIEASFLVTFIMLCLSLFIILCSCIYFYFARLPAHQALIVPALPIVLMIPQVFLTFIHIPSTNGVCGFKDSISSSADYGLLGGAWCQIAYSVAFIVAYCMLVAYSYVHVYRYQQLPIAKGLGPSRRLSGSVPSARPSEPEQQRSMFAAFMTMLRGGPESSQDNSALGRLNAHLAAVDANFQRQQRNAPQPQQQTQQGATAAAAASGGQQPQQRQRSASAASASADSEEESGFFARFRSLLETDEQRQASQRRRRQRHMARLNARGQPARAPYAATARARTAASSTPPPAATTASAVAVPETPASSSPQMVPAAAPVPRTAEANT